MTEKNLPRFLVSPNALQQATIDLPHSEHRHARARRIAVGDSVELIDGEGQRRGGLVLSISQEHAMIRLSDSLDPAESPLDLTLAMAVLKGSKADWAVEKATELGVSRILFFTSDNSITRPSASKFERWQRVVASAAKQCGRSRLPVIEGTLSLEALVAHKAQLRIVLHEKASSTFSDLQPGNCESILMTVGPEGGFSEHEIDFVRDAGFFILRLSQRILRAETAAVVSVTLAQQTWGDLTIDRIP